MRPKFCFRIALIGLLFALGCGSDDKVLDGEDLPGVDGGNGGTDAGNSSGSDAGNSGGNANAGGNDGGANGDFVGGTPSDPTCDMNGIWIGNQVTRSEALLAGQFSNNWYYLEFTQEGDDILVSRHFDCGIEVRGSVTVQITPDAANALRGHNIQTGRKGTIKKGSSGKCDVKFDRFWSIRGADEMRFAPTPRNSTQSIAELKGALPLPTKEKPDGAQDWDGDGSLGTAWQVTGIVMGTRNSVQRDWTEWFSDDKYAITPATDFKNDVVIRARFDNEENVFETTSAGLSTTSTADSGAEHTLTLRFLGRTRSDPRVKAIVKPNDFDTCKAVQAALPVQDSL